MTFKARPTCLSSVLSLFLLASILPSFIQADPGIKEPPHIRGDKVSRYTHKLGDAVKIDCPIDATPPPIYEWFKGFELRNREAITEAWDKRFRVKGKTLRIKAILAEDAGVYVCKGINGFGRKEFSIRLIVEDENGQVLGGDEEEDAGSDEHDELPDGVLGIIPKIVELSRPPSGHIFRPILGSTLVLFCKVEGQPLPMVSWYKVKERSQPAIVTGEQQLVLKSVKLEDSGTYVCVASNEYGHVNASFGVTVVERSLWEPKITLVEPLNWTVALGREIQFRCHVKSENLPEIKWYREVKPSQQQQDKQQQRNRNTESEHKISSENYQAMNGTENLIHARNGTYISELTWKIHARDAGAYLCVVPSNLEGRRNIVAKTVLNILPHTDNDPFLPIGAVIAIPSTLVILFVALAIVVCCVRRTQGVDTSSGNLTITTTYASPRDVIHEHTHHHRHTNGGSIPFYNGSSGTTRSSQPPCMGMMGRNIPSHLGTQHQYFCKEPSSSAVKILSQANNSSSAYASVPICENPPPIHSSTFGLPASRAPPLPSRPNFPPSTRDRASYNNQGLLTQPLLTQTASSSDSRDSRQSTSGRTEFPNHRQMDQWGSSGASDASSERKNSRGHHIRL